MSEMVEQKVIEKVRRTLLDDADIKGYIGDRVYAAHVSTISSPKYPAISLTLMPGQARTDVPEMVNMTFRVDLWFPSADYTVDDVMKCYARIRILLHKVRLSDTEIGVKIMQIRESGIGPMLYDIDMAGHHLPARYAVVCI